MNESMGLLGRKVGMTQLFAADGNVTPVTVVETGPCTVLQVKSTSGKDGYAAIQFGFGAKKESRATKAAIGHAKAAGVPVTQVVGEVRVNEATASSYQKGQVVGAADVFATGQFVDVTGTPKGRGFAGVFKKFHFAGFERSHGTHEYFRHGGSIGTRLTPGMTMAGKKMPGQWGNTQVTLQNIVVAKVDAERNLVYLAGSVPGPNGGYVTLRKSVKKTK